MWHDNTNNVENLTTRLGELEPLILLALVHLQDGAYAVSIHDAIR